MPNLWLALALAAQSHAFQNAEQRVQAAVSNTMPSLEAGEAALGQPPTQAAGKPADEDQELDDQDKPYDFNSSGNLKTHCETVLGTPKWRYCVTITKGSQNHTILYFLHGHGHNAENWARSKDYKRRIREDWAKAGRQAPIVVSVSFGGFWLLIEKNKSSRSGLLDFFAADVMPKVEQGLPTDGSPRRILMGESMGGFNGAQMVLKYPALFSRAALACPALAHISPYASDAEVQAYKSQPGVSGFKVWLMIHLARKTFKSEADFRKSDPFTIGQTRLGPGTPPMIVSCGDRDQYGLYKSVGEFVDLARSKGADVTYTPLHGGHCSADPAAMAGFLLP